MHIHSLQSKKTKLKVSSETDAFSSLHSLVRSVLKLKERDIGDIL